MCVGSSFILALAGDLGYNICILNLNERGLTDDKLAYLLATVPQRSLVLLEDIDAAFNARAKAGDAGAANMDRYHVTFSGLLNSLDGVASTEERLVFMTTNHAERLDPALIRPGRVDVQQFIGLATEHQVRTLFRRFYPRAATEQPELLEQFVQHLGGAQLSVAELQGHFLMFKDDVQAAVTHEHVTVLVRARDEREKLMRGEATPVSNLPVGSRSEQSARKAAS